MIVNGDRKNFFGVILADDMLIEKGFDDARFLEVEDGFFVGSTFACGLLFAQFAVNDGFANPNAGITNENTGRTGDHLFHFPLWFPTKEQKLILVAFAIRLPVQSLGFFDITSSTKPYSLASSADM